jgi:protein TonB
VEPAPTLPTAAIPVAPTDLQPPTLPVESAAAPAAPAIEDPVPATAVARAHEAAPGEPPATRVASEPPQLIARHEPTYPERARKRGEGGVIALRVLVSETGQVVRVVVEEGLLGSELEARAIEAALRSTYRPATEDGRPVRGWTTERFVFQP